MKLGCLTPKILPNQPILMNTRMMARLPPARLIRDHIDPSPRILGNDVTSDCTSAGIGNAHSNNMDLGVYRPLPVARLHRTLQSTHGAMLN